MKVRIPLSNSGILSAHGYEDVREKSPLARHRALMRVVRAGEPPLGHITLSMFWSHGLSFLLLSAILKCEIYDDFDW